MDETALDLTRRILHQDSNLLVIDKPAGIAVHRGPSGRPAIEDYLAPLSFGRRTAPVPAHRLDHGTSGCLVLARHAKARARLGHLFEAGAVRKVYWAVTDRPPPDSSGRIELPLAKHNSMAGWRMVPDAGTGKPAVTLWRVLVSTEGLSLIEAMPLTGRTHQVRVHLAALGCPLVGDEAYGGTAGPRSLLHARRIEIPYWPDRPPITVESAVPDGFLQTSLTLLPLNEAG